MQAEPRKDTPFRESTKPLLMPHQAVEFQEEKARLEATINAPPHIASQVQNRGLMVTQLRRLNEQLEKQLPRPYPAEDKDRAVARADQLLEEITAGMPTTTEMRRNPAGATDKHRAWEARNKTKILEWKNIRRRLHAGGDLDGVHPDARDVSNIEMFRPAGASHELNMHNEQIPGKAFYGLEGAGSGVTFTDHEISVLKAAIPELAGRLGALSNAQRAQIKAILSGAEESAPRGFADPSPSAQDDSQVEYVVEDEPRKPKKGRKPMSAEARAAAGARLRALNAARREKAKMPGVA